MSADREADGLPGGAGKRDLATDAMHDYARDRAPSRSKLWLVPFVGEVAGAPVRVDGELEVKEAATAAARGEAIFISAATHAEAHRIARLAVEARSLVRQLRESTEAFREGYESALRELAAFLAKEAARVDSEPTSANWIGGMAEIHEIEIWMAARTAKGA